MVYDTRHRTASWKVIAIGYGEPPDSAGSDMARIELFSLARNPAAEIRKDDVQSIVESFRDVELGDGEARHRENITAEAR